jgi:hypothetical protein
VRERSWRPRVLLRLMTATSRVVVVLYGVVGLVISVAVSGLHTWGNWPIGMVLGSLAVVAGALLSWWLPAAGGFIVALGAIAGVTTFAFGDYAGCKPPSGTCTAHAEFDLAFVIAFIPVFVGLSWLIGAVAQHSRLGGVGSVSLFVFVVFAIVVVADVATGHTPGFLLLILVLAAAFAALRAWKRRDLKP